jgi:fumarate reductase flavoprotein subunit
MNGKRFWDEGLRTSFYGMITREGMRQPGGLYWVVFDEKARKQLELSRMGKVKPHQANTIEEVAKKAGIDPKGLKATVDKYNSDIESVGYDTVFDRRTLVGVDGTPITIDTPPFYAIRLTATTTSFKGGLKINSRCQVVNQYDEVIPGLYAAGEVTGGLWGADGTYLPNTMVPAAMTFGRVAGMNAAAETPW